MSTEAMIAAVRRTFFHLPRSQPRSQSQKGAAVANTLMRPTQSESQCLAITRVRNRNLQHQIEPAHVYKLRTMKYAHTKEVGRGAIDNYSPHVVVQASGLAAEGESLGLQAVGLVHQQLNALPSVQHL